MKVTKTPPTRPGADGVATDSWHVLFPSTAARLGFGRVLRTPERRPDTLSEADLTYPTRFAAWDACPLGGVIVGPALVEWRGSTGFTSVAYP